VRAAVDGYVRSDQRPRTDGHKAGIDDRAVEIDENAFSEADVGAVVDVNRWLNPGITCEQLLVFVLR